MTQTQCAELSMRSWLEVEFHLDELDTIDLTSEGTFQYDDLTYYMFQYSINEGPVYLGMAGGFYDNTKESCGHTFSARQPFNRDTAEQDCIKMIEAIKAHWRARL